MLFILAVVIGFYAAYQGLPFLYRTIGKNYAFAVIGAIVVLTLISAGLGIASAVLLSLCTYADNRHRKEN